MKEKTCQDCQRVSPPDFHYCGFCGKPFEQLPAYEYAQQALAPAQQQQQILIQSSGKIRAPLSTALSLLFYIFGFSIFMTGLTRLSEKVIYISPFALILFLIPLLFLFPKNTRIPSPERRFRKPLLLWWQRLLLIVCCTILAALYLLFLRSPLNIYPLLLIVYGILCMFIACL